MDNRKVFTIKVSAYAGVAGAMVFLTCFIVLLALSTFWKETVLSLTLIPIGVLGSLLALLLRYVALFPFRIVICDSGLEVISPVGRRMYAWTSINSVQIGVISGSVPPLANRHKITVHAGGTHVVLYDWVYPDEGVPLQAVLLERCERNGIPISTDVIVRRSPHETVSTDGARTGRDGIALRVVLLAIVVSLAVACVLAYDFTFIRVIAALCLIMVMIIVLGTRRT